MSGMRVVTAVRARPMSSTEVSSGAVNILSYDSVSKGIGVTHPSAVGKGGSAATPERVFNFDYNFWSVYKADPYYSSQEAVFLEVGMPIIENCLQGMNCSLFAYGQTGSGKTYTMMGSSDSDESMGLIPRICKSILGQLTSKDLNIEGSVEKLLSAKVFVSFLEIYNEKIFDLLASTSGVTSRVREHPENGAYVENLTKVKAESYADILQALSDGKRKRQVASTLMNSESSRSHAVFTIYVVQQICSTTEFERSSKVSLVDLAGSERVNNSGVTGDRLKEASNINKSLSTLGDVINALSEKGNGADNAFIPYRNSTLTWLLKDSLGGNSKTSMLATISPADANYGESMSTLRYLERAKLIVNKVSINESHWENPQVAMLQKQLSELNAKYVALLKLHQSREVEYEATLAKIQLDVDNSGSARVEELQRYIAHLENQLGLPQSQCPLASNVPSDNDEAGGDQTAAISIAEVECELNQSLPFSDPEDIDPDELLNKEAVSVELERAVSEMLSVVCGETVPAEDCRTAAAVFSSVMDRHVEPMRVKYRKLLERHKLLERWYAQEREIVNAKNSQLDELTGEITNLRRNVFRSQSFVEESNILATIQEGENSLFDEDDDSEDLFASPSSRSMRSVSGKASDRAYLTRGSSQGGSIASVMHKLEDELAATMINLQNVKRVQEEQAEIHSIEMQDIKVELKRSGEKLAAMKLERDNMASNMMEVNNARVSLENDIKSMYKEMRQQNAKFSDRLMAKDSEIALLTEQLAAVQSGIAESEGNYKKEIAVLESHLKAQTKAVVLLKAEQESARRKYAQELDNTLVGTEASHMAIREELADVKARLQATHGELESLKEEREADAIGFLNELDMEELKFTNAKKQWAADEEKLKSEISYWVAELENVREEASTGIDELRDALMSQSEVHKIYEVEKENEISVLKTWLEEAQADLEQMHKSKDIELAAVNESTLKLKSDLESQVYEKTALVATMMENIDNLTKKCHKWDVAYDSLKKKYDELHSKFAEQEEARQLALQLAKEEFFKALEQKDEIIASAAVRYDELVKEYAEKQAEKEKELCGVKDELSTQLLRYDMLELDEVTEVDALKTEIHYLEEKDQERLREVTCEKERVTHDMESLAVEYQTYRSEIVAELMGKNSDIDALRGEISSLSIKLQGSEDQVFKVTVRQEEIDKAHQLKVVSLTDIIDMLMCRAAMAVEELIVVKLMLEAERAKLRTVYVSATAAIAGESISGDAFSEQSNDPDLSVIGNRNVADSENLAKLVEDASAEEINVDELEYDEDSRYEDEKNSQSIESNAETAVAGVRSTEPIDNCESASPHKLTDSSTDVNIRGLAFMVLEYLDTKHLEQRARVSLNIDEAYPSFDSLSLGSETIEGLTISMEKVALLENIATKLSEDREAGFEDIIHKLEHEKEIMMTSYESTITDLKENYESKAFALDVARNTQEAEIIHLQEEIIILKAELDKSRNDKESLVTAVASSASGDQAVVSEAVQAIRAPPPIKAKAKKKIFWSCAGVNESEVVNPTTELPRR